MFKYGTVSNIFTRFSVCRSVLRILEVDLGYRIRLFPLPDPKCFHPGSQIRIQKFKYFNPKQWFVSCRKYDPAVYPGTWSWSWLFTHPRSRIPGSKRHRIPIRNTDVGIVIFGTFNNSNFKKGANNQSIIANLKCQGTCTLPYVFSPQQIVLLALGNMILVVYPDSGSRSRTRILFSYKARIPGSKRHQFFPLITYSFSTYRQGCGFGMIFFGSWSGNDF